MRGHFKSSMKRVEKKVSIVSRKEDKIEKKALEKEYEAAPLNSKESIFKQKMEDSKRIQSQKEQDFLLLKKEADISSSVVVTSFEKKKTKFEIVKQNEAELSGGKNEDDTDYPLVPVVPSYQDYSVALADFTIDKDSLSGLDIEEKLELKAEYIEKWKEYAERFAYSDSKISNEIFVFWSIWHLDIGDVQTFYKYCKIAISKQQRSPFKRSLRDFLIEEVHKYLMAKKDTIHQHKEILNLYMLDIDENESVLEQNIISEAYYLKFHCLLKLGDKEEAYRFGKIALEKGAKVKMKLNDLEKGLM